MSRAPFLLTGAREGWKYGSQTTLDSMQHDGLWCAFENLPMGASADYIAATRDVSRADQDRFALESHVRAVAAATAGRFAEEIVPVVISGRKGDVRIDRDEGPRADSSLEVLGRLKPSFAANGTVTAGNSSQISDGAAAVVVVNEEIARASHAPLKARIVAAATSGVAPKEIFIAPVAAIEKVLDRARPEVIGHRPDRAERGLCGPVFGVHAAPRPHVGKN